MKNIPKFIKIFLAATFILHLFGFGLILSAGAAQAADSINLKYSVPLPGGPANTDFTTNKSTKPIADYIKLIYKYAIGVVGILATVVMMVGGIMWIMSGGSPERAGEAKAYISASLTGLVLTLFSYLILATVNPALTNFKLTEVGSVVELGCCYSWTDSTKTKIQCDAMTELSCNEANRQYYAGTCGSIFYCTSAVVCNPSADDNGTACITAAGEQGYCVIGSSACTPCIKSGGVVDIGYAYRCCSKNSTLTAINQAKCD